MSDDQIQVEQKRIDALGNTVFKSAPLPVEELERFKQQYGAKYPPGDYYIDPLKNGELQKEFPNLAMIARHYPQYQRDLPGLVNQIEREKGQAPRFDADGTTPNVRAVFSKVAPDAARTPAPEVKPDAQPKACVVELDFGDNIRSAGLERTVSGAAAAICPAPAGPGLR